MPLDAKSVEIRTKSIETILEPLIHQLHILVGENDFQNHPKGLSRGQDDILKTITATLADYIQVGNEIVHNYSDMASDFRFVLADIQDCGNHFHRAVIQFLEDPINEEIQSNLLRCARTLLSSVTRLLILVDLVDVQCLQACIDKIRRDADGIKAARGQRELGALTTSLFDDMSELGKLLQPRTQDLLDSIQRDDLALAQYNLRQSSVLLVSASKAYLAHPELATIGANQNYAAQMTHEALDRVSRACNVTYLQALPPASQGQAVMEILSIIMQTARDETDKTNCRVSTQLSALLKKLSSEVSTLSDVAGLSARCQSAMSLALQHLNEAVNELIDAWEFQSSTELEAYLDAVGDACSDIRSLIAKDALSTSSEAFLWEEMTMNFLEEAAKTANEQELISAAGKVQQQTSDVIDVALSLCSLSSNTAAVSFARFTAMDLEQVAPQLINASKALALRNKSQVALENYYLFAKAYTMIFTRLRTAVDDLTDVFDYVDVLNDLLANDIARCESDARSGQIRNLMQTCRLLSTRCGQAIEFIADEIADLDMDKPYVTRITTAISEIQGVLVPKYNEVAKDLCRRIKSRDRLHIDSLRDTGDELRRKFNELKLLFQKLKSDNPVTIFNDLPPMVPPRPPRKTGPLSET